MTSRVAPAFLALAGVAAVTALWWAFALWPLPDSAPTWLERARAICFGKTASGLPEASGWLALVLQPSAMVAMVLAIWGRELRRGLAAAGGTWAGRATLGALGLFILGAGGLVAWRVADATAAADAARIPVARVVPLDGVAPPLRLTDQYGSTFDMARQRGRPVLVVFAFAHCRTVCPLLVQEARAAQRAADGVRAALVVVTLDPWRDTPARLPHLAREWKLGSDAWALSGSVREVEAVLEAWGIPRSRNRVNGDIVHEPRIYVVDRQGRLAYATTGGGARPVLQLLRSL